MKDLKLSSFLPRSSSSNSLHISRMRRKKEKNILNPLEGYCALALYLLQQKYDHSSYHKPEYNINNKFH